MSIHLIKKVDGFHLCFALTVDICPRLSTILTATCDIKQVQDRISI